MNYSEIKNFPDADYSPFDHGTQTRQEGDKFYDRAKLDDMQEDHYMEIIRELDKP